MGVPIHYRKVPENIVKSYDYIDVADGTGVVIFFGASTMADTTESYFLTRNALYSHSVNVQAASGAGTPPTFARNLDLDFDLTTFNLPRRIKGVCRGNITVGGRTTAPPPPEIVAVCVLAISTSFFFIMIFA